MMEKMKILIGMFILVLIVSACQTEENETSSPTEGELKKTTFTYNGESYPAVYHVNCLNEAACEESSTNADEPYSEWKDDVELVKVNANIGDEVKFNFPESVPDPERLFMQKQQGATGMQETLKNKSIEIMGEENTKITYIINAEWKEEGTKTADVQFAFIVPNPSLTE